MGWSARPVGWIVAGLLSVASVGCSGRRGEPTGTDGLMDWPARGPVTSLFGPRGTAHHDGIDIAAGVGTPVRAAAGGWVRYAGQLSGYGNVVILEHRFGLRTIYAHNQRNLVAAGESVKRGKVIALLGRTGRATGPNLHFEVRRESRPEDPLGFLGEHPASSVAASLVKRQGS